MQIEIRPTNPFTDILPDTRFVWSDLAPQEHDLIRRVLGGGVDTETANAHSIFTVGRNTFIKRQTDDPIYTHIQLSGGWYQSFDAQNGILKSHNTPPQRANASNFVPGREEMFTSERILENGEMIEEPRSYAPSGAYTAGQAFTKIKNTLSIQKSLAIFASEEQGPPPFIAPQIIEFYTFPEITDPDGLPIAGIAMLTPNPLGRFDGSLSLFFHDYPIQKPESLQLFLTTYGSRFYLAGQALRTLHDVFGLYHGQYTGGNCGTVLHDNTETPLIADFHTLKYMPQKKIAAVAASSLDISIFLRTNNVLFARIVQEAQCDPQILLQYQRGLLHKTLTGYLGPDSTYKTPVESQAISYLFSTPGPMFMDFISGLLSEFRR
jgi:hypothetical protein